VTSRGELKEMQLQKLGNLEAFDRAWDRRYPNETEERFEWPWQSLTMKQVALGEAGFSQVRRSAQRLEPVSYCNLLSIH